MWEVVKTVKGYDITRMIGSRGAYHVSVREGKGFREFHTFKTIISIEPGQSPPAERENMDITKELARAVKYYMIMEDTFLNPGNFKEAHKNFVEKMEEYEKKENLTEEEAQYNIEIAAEALKKYRAEQ